MIKILTIIGARPQFIKAGTVSRAIAEHNTMISGKLLGSDNDLPSISWNKSAVNEIIIHTGQHFDKNMSEVFFEELDIPEPEYNIGVSGGGHGAMTGVMMEKLEPLVQEINPEWVLVYGDTNSTLAGALTAAKLNIPVAHVEAGLRSFNRAMPEEINRVLTDHCAELLFAPTDTATQNLHNEGVRPERISQVGDVMFDAALYYRDKAKRTSQILIKNRFQPKGYALATIHRQENTDNPSQLENIFKALQTVAREIPVVFPLHPRTKNRLAEFGLKSLIKGLNMLAPVGYLDMVMLESEAAVIATDSGGIQKESYFHGVPCVALRNETEWEELIDSGWNRLAPTRAPEIADCIISAIGSRGSKIEPYGNGKAARQIVKILTSKT